ncbi:hypothetical protein HYN59_12630 [Flavobacterium album]|uniref:Uncharacterized protein n=1 Tax=Flavobacterium album TaxID=2175091 RepID=A0A2S1QZQ9_9FLAO|nr:hypothetical protein [Flavobacterium album]AWH85898.1 hypothetical protein HYN59_12630 [Flavobacterium album]
MKELTVKRQDKLYTIYNGDSVYGQIIFDDKGFGAAIIVDGNIYRTEQENPKSANKILKHNDTILFRFKYDKIWGGATLQSGNEDMGYSIIGKWFKPGTRLIDKDKTDLVVVVSSQGFKTKIRTEIHDETIAPVMVMATIYYHLYASAAKTMAVGIISGM